MCLCRQLAVQGEDGQPVPFRHRRQIRISTTVRRRSDTTRTFDDVIKTVPDDSIVRHSFVPEPDDYFVTIRVSPICI